MSKRTHPTYDTAEDWAASLDQALLHCRELGHSWSAYTASYDAKAKVYDRTLRCGSCGTERRQVLDQYGQVVRNGYSYVDGYLAKGYFDQAGHKVPRSTFRLTALQRAVSTAPRSRARSRRPRLKAV